MQAALFAAGAALGKNGGDPVVPGLFGKVGAVACVKRLAVKVHLACERIKQ